MSLGDKILGRHLEEVAPQLAADFSDVDLHLSRDGSRRLQLEGVIDGVPVVYQFVGGGELGGAWQISVQGPAIEALGGLLRASVVEKGRRWIEKRAGQERVIPARADGATAAWVLGGDRSVLLVTARNQETIATLVASGVADSLLSIPPEAQYYASGRLDAQMPKRWRGRHPVDEVSTRIRACVDAIGRLPA